MAVVDRTLTSRRPRTDGETNGLPLDGPQRVASVVAGSARPTPSITSGQEEQASGRARADRAPFASPAAGHAPGGGDGWRFVAGTIIAVAVLRETFRRANGSRVAVQARSVSRGDMMLVTAALLGTLQRAGARVLARS
jgi:hypothetical protein